MSYSQQKPLNIVAISGGLNAPSKTEALLQTLVERLAKAIPIQVHFIKFSEIAPLLGGAIYPQSIASTSARRFSYCQKMQMH